MNAENFLSGQLVFGEEFIRPFLLIRRQKNFDRVRRQFHFSAKQRQHVKIVFDRMTRVILQQNLVDEFAVEPAEAFVFVADADGRAGDARGDAIMHPALRMRVDGNVVTFAPQRPKKAKCLELAGLDEVFLMDAIEMRIVFQQVSGTGPQHQRVNRRAGKIRAQLVDERRGQQRVADARHGNDQNFHSFSSW